MIFQVLDTTNQWVLPSLTRCMTAITVSVPPAAPTDPIIPSSIESELLAFTVKPVPVALRSMRISCWPAVVARGRFTVVPSVMKYKIALPLILPALTVPTDRLALATTPVSPAPLPVNEFPALLNVTALAYVAAANTFAVIVPVPEVVSDPPVPTVIAAVVLVADERALNGKLVALPRLTLEGVPSAGVTSVGEVPNTRLPVPVEVVTTAVRRLVLVGVA